MCFHTHIAAPVAKIEDQLQVKISDPKLISLFDTPQYHLNGFAHPNMLVIPQERRELLAPGVWGIAPSNTPVDGIKAYYKQAVRYGGGLNAQSEKLFSHALYKESALSRRCIIPVTGFFEPHTYQNKKYPFYIHHKDAELLPLAGLYTVIGSYITFSILTKAASPLFERIHNQKKRQPVILSKSVVHNWLNPELNPTDLKRCIHSPFPDAELKTYTVSKDVFSPKEDSNVARITDRVSYAELPEVV
ncbi:SOS response-associated peptidase [Flavobacteriaceae bacterium LMO-SS05]